MRRSDGLQTHSSISCSLEVAVFLHNKWARWKGNESEIYLQLYVNKYVITLFRKNDQQGTSCWTELQPTNQIQKWDFLNHSVGSCMDLRLQLTPNSNITSEHVWTCCEPKNQPTHGYWPTNCTVVGDASGYPQGLQARWKVTQKLSRMAPTKETYRLYPHQHRSLDDMQHHEISMIELQLLSRNQLSILPNVHMSVQTHKEISLQRVRLSRPCSHFRFFPLIHGIECIATNLCEQLPP